MISTPVRLLHCRMKEVALAVGLLLAATSPAFAQSDQSREEAAFRDGADVYVYGYPLVTIELARRVMTNTRIPEHELAPMGQFFHPETFPTPEYKLITAPNTDTLNSTAWLDLSKEPYVLEIPDQQGHYYMMSVFSAWTNDIVTARNRTTGTDKQTYLITGPKWQGSRPKGLTEVQSPTGLVWIIARIYSLGTPDDLAAVRAIQDQYKLIPLSAYGKPYTPPEGTIDPSIDTNTPVREQVNHLDAATFFATMAALMKNNPPGPEDEDMVAKMAKLGIVPGHDFDIGKLDPVVAKGLERAPQAGLERILAHEKDAGKHVNGWVFSTELGNYGTDYLERAYISTLRLGASILTNDGIYLLTRESQDGKPLSGGNRYVIHFANYTPFVEDFWSITMYDDKLFLVANPIARYALGSRSGLRNNEDGTTDLYIQAASPGPEKESNWLPAPPGNFTLMVRMYSPQGYLSSGRWEMPPVQRVSSEEQATVPGSAPPGPADRQ